MTFPSLLSSGRPFRVESPRVPLLRHYSVLSFPVEQGEPTATEETEMLAFALGEARRAAMAHFGDPEAFVLIHSGRGNRRTDGWHIHIVPVSGRIQKAWLYFVLWGKNVLQALGRRRDRRRT